MTYSYNKKGKQVTAIAADNVINSEMCFVDGATHVVTEVKYGFERKEGPKCFFSN